VEWVTARPNYDAGTLHKVEWSGRDIGVRNNTRVERKGLRDPPIRLSGLAKHGRARPNTKVYSPSRHIHLRKAKGPSITVLLSLSLRLIGGLA
jgi:hypothetical protein